MADDNSPPSKAEVRELLSDLSHKLRGEMQLLSDRFHGESEKIAQKVLEKAMDGIGVDLATSDGRERSRRTWAWATDGRKRTELIGDERRKNAVGIWYGIAAGLVIALAGIFLPHIAWH